MKLERWANTNLPHAHWLGKLGEEFGEVARANLLLDRVLISSNPRKAGLKARRKELISELEHVEFIAAQFRRQIEFELENGEQFAAVTLNGGVVPARSAYTDI
jgi:NTP pyrophosphatase (non-canonical NTP hydrolase)